MARPSIDAVSTLLELTGVAVVAIGATLLAPWLGVVIFGLGLIGIGYLLGLPSPAGGGDE